MNILRIIIALVLFNQVLAQENFPVNGVVETFDPIYAFTNANIIISPGVELKNSTLLIQGERILVLDTQINIPKGAIIYDLNNDYIYPSFKEMSGI